MGQAKLKQHNRQQFLVQHPWCTYCGAPATTTDHCPPRGFFEGRQWPETYEFPACGSCNQEARRDEQALAVLTRVKLDDSRNRKEPGKTEWEKLFRGVLNNQPDIVAEWKQNVSRNSLRRSLREAFGENGDLARRAGWGALTLGPLTCATIERFVVKLGKALYYRHIGALFDGTIYANHISVLARDNTPEFMAEVLRLAPELSEPRRNNRSLADQFLYRFNGSSDFGVVYAVVQFSEQFIFRIFAICQRTADNLETKRQHAGLEVPLQGRYLCPLKHRPATI